MTLHLITDRRRLAPAGDERARAGCLKTQVGHAVAAGVDIIQLREPDLEAAALRVLAADLLALLAGSPTRLVVNDRLDVALAAGAHGVHLRSTSMPASRIRAVVPDGFLVGRSVHSVDEASSAGPVDYVIAGSVWMTTAKPAGHTTIGLAGLSAIVATATVPVVAIGGVLPSNAGAVLQAGASGIAAIAAWMGATDARGCRAAALHDTAHAFRTASDADNMGAMTRR
jgi:thiamine-phosphate pyrophosphorylase